MKEHIHGPGCNHGPHIAELTPIDASLVDDAGATSHVTVAEYLGELPKKPKAKAEVDGDNIRYTDEHGEVFHFTVDRNRNHKLWREMHRRVKLLTEAGMVPFAARCEELFRDAHTWADGATLQLALDVGLCFQGYRRGKNFKNVRMAFNAAMGKRLKEFVDTLAG